MTIKKFIHNFNFPNPSWDSLPEGFPNLTKEDLTKEESHLLDAIILAWMNSKNGKRYLRRKAARTATLFVLISLITIISSKLVSGVKGLTQPVNAATVSATIRQNVEQAIESTRSAIFKGN